jgi:hypothetical protein
MLKLIYDTVDAGAPSQYGNAIDVFRDENRNMLQNFPKTQAGFAPAEPALAAAIDTWLAARGDRAEPVVVMVHGYLYDPSKNNGMDPDSPFQLTYGYPSPTLDAHLTWLPIVGECDQNGQNRAENAVAFAYRSEADIAATARAGWNNSYQYAVFDLSPLAARALASVLVYLGSKPITLRVLAHSLGTRTFSQALRLIRARMPPNLDRVVLLDGAEFCVDAAANFAACPFDVFNVSSRMDTVLRLGATQLCHPMRQNGSLSACVIGFDGLGGGNDRWLDMQFDSQALVDWYAAANAPDGIPYSIDAAAEEGSHPSAGMDHWACYTNDGNRALLRDLLASDVMTGAQFKAHGIPLGNSSPAFGRFDGVAVPTLPQSTVERQRLIAQALAQSSGAVG